MGVLEASMHPDITWKTWEDFRVQGIGNEIGVDEDGLDARSTLVSNNNRV